MSRPDSVTAGTAAAAARFESPHASQDLVSCGQRHSSVPSPAANSGLDKPIEKHPVAGSCRSKIEAVNGMDRMRANARARAGVARATGPAGDGGRRPGQWLLTGSQGLALMRGVTQTRAGRITVPSPGPLTVAETQERPSHGSLEELLARGFDVAERTGAGATAAAGSGDFDLGEWILRGGDPTGSIPRGVDRDGGRRGVVANRSELRDPPHCGYRKL
jgi:hypothetical protein